MHDVTVIEFTTLDGIVDDPDGSAGTATGGWAFRYGPEAVAGDKFELGSRLDDGVLLLGRRTWQQFSKLWPGRSDEFSARMNAAPKRVVSRTLTDVGAWANSAVLTGELTDEVRRLREERDVVVIGSASVAHTLLEQRLVDEVRLLVFPVVLGSGRRWYAGPVDLELVSATQRGPAALLRYRAARA
ncbi:dihydrofolate reductase family protein [Amycolatopsis sp. OK19-0408]|uniref:Dihydrofolate reductase family protein n=1 Tax=Amycolatopsis iheyensis TaxID=2945988 RepID=A0A9X2NKL4_9PSEU|nr:dihydrofolate reductase family protein [Amycolatopsis iheyensis]MCR6488027.1 dihydrofolate reductase family protein [Amycolatopsis iheyensis]